MGKKRIWRKTITLLVLFTFLTGGTYSAPVFAADGAHSLVVMAASDAPGLWDSITSKLTGFFGSDSNKNQGQALSTQAPPVYQTVPAGNKLPKAEKVKELVEKRTANAKYYQLADGRIQAEISSGPVHYKDSQGNWQDIDPKLAPSDNPGFAYKNDKNTFQSFFSNKPAELVKFQVDKYHVIMGIAAEQNNLNPKAEGRSVTYAAAFSQGQADLTYEITPEALKEKIVLTKAPDAATYSFDFTLGGVDARQLKDGSIAFYPKGSDVRPVFVIPKPFMMDSQDDTSSPYGKTWSDKVSQTVTQKGAHIQVTIIADETWLKDSKRKYPVVIDPTLKIQPTPTDAQDSMILSNAPDTNYGTNWRLSVGTTSTYIARSLLKFNLSGIPQNTVIDSAVLKTYYDQWFQTNANNVEIEAHRITSPWNENTVTWNSASVDSLGTKKPWTKAGGDIGGIEYNRETVDDSDTSKVAINGSWPDSTNTTLKPYGYKSTYKANKNTVTGETFTWIPRLTEDGNYQVNVHYVTASDRTTAAPYTLYYNGGQQQFSVNQNSSTAAGVWQSLKPAAGTTFPFVAGNTHKIVLGDVSDGTAVIADAVQFTKWGTDIKKANVQNTWNNFSIRSAVQDWITNPTSNYGIMLKPKSETLGQGGVRYEASENAYNGETANAPTLVITYGRPSVTLHDPTKIHATGAELQWDAYTDPNPTSTADDIVEYQVHRNVYQTFTPSAATLVASVAKGTTQYTDTTAQPTPADSTNPYGNAYYYMIVVKTQDGSLVPSPTRLVRLPKAGSVIQILQGSAADTTLASYKADQNFDSLGGYPWLEVGNNSGTYGIARSLVKFDLSAIPSGITVQDAKLNLWTDEKTEPSPAPTGNGNFSVYSLNKGFNETQATWNKADTATAWSTPGGDYNTTALYTVPSITNDPKWISWNTASIVQQWLNGTQANNGFLIKKKDEGLGSERVLFLSSEAQESELRPKLVVTYAEKTN